MVGYVNLNSEIEDSSFVLVVVLVLEKS